MQFSYPVYFNLSDRSCGHLVRAVMALGCLLTSRPAQAARPQERPSFEAVAAAAQRVLDTQAEYRDGDLLRRSQVEAVLKSVAATGWELNSPEQVVELALSDSSFLVRELSSLHGKKLMRKVAAHPGSYARLDRLSTIPRGQRIIHDLIHQPDGDDLITYLTTTKGGRNLGKMMGGVRNGVDLNKPTGRIYTASDLLAVLKKLYDKNAQ